MVATLRLIHIVFGGFWAGAAMLMGWLVVPTARSVGPASGPFMQALLKRRLADILVGSGVVTVLAGIWLWALRPPSFGVWQGYALAIGALASIVAILIGFVLQRPTAKKVQSLGGAIAAGGGPPSQSRPPRWASCKRRWLPTATSWPTCSPSPWLGWRSAEPEFG